MIIAIANQKGGTGKTTTVVSVGHCLALMGERVLLVDMDPQGHVGRSLFGPQHQLAPKAPDAGSLLTGAALAACTVEARPNLHVVRSDGMLKSAEYQLEARMVGRAKALARALDGAPYDTVLIDCPPTLGLLTLNALFAAEYVMVPVRLEQLSADGLTELAGTIGAVQGEGCGVSLAWIVPTMKRHTNEHARQLSVLRQLFGAAVVPAVPQATAITEAQGREQTIWEYDSKCAPAAAYYEIACMVQRATNGKAKA